MDTLSACPVLSYPMRLQLQTHARKVAHDEIHWSPILSGSHQIQRLLLAYSDAATSRPPALPDTTQLFTSRHRALRIRDPRAQATTNQSAPFHAGDPRHEPGSGPGRPIRREETHSQPIRTVHPARAGIYQTDAAL